MLVVETIAKIRRAYFVQKKAIKEICRELKVSRKVVRRVVRSGATEFVYERKVQPQPKIGPWREELDRLLATNAARASRERLTLIRVFEELRGLGYEGGYDAVRRYAAGWQRERSAATAAAFVPLSFAPGEAYQFDWSHEVVLIAGVTVTVKVAQVRLCHSRMLFVRAYPRESQEMVFDAHDRAFAFFKGACTRGIYDNMKTAVDAILVGKARDYNRRFQQMCGHYLVEPVACTPASGWEKGQVENQVGTVRQRFEVRIARLRARAGSAAIAASSRRSTSAQAASSAAIAEPRHAGDQRTPGSRRMADRACAIVGAGPGNGLAFARRFAAEGYRVALVGRTREKLEAVAAEVPREPGGARATPPTPPRLARPSPRIRDELGPVDVLLYNAGSGQWGNFEEITAEGLEAGWRTNVLGLLVAGQAVAPT